LKNRLTLIAPKQWGESQVLLGGQPLVPKEDDTEVGQSLPDRVDSGGRRGPSQIDVVDDGAERRGECLDLHRGPLTLCRGS
jgi:hypothetical protein